MELREFVERTLSDIVEGIKAVNGKLDELEVKHGSKVTFTVAIQATEGVNTEGGANLGIKVFNAGAKQGKTSKDEVCNTVTFDAFFVRKEDAKNGDLPNFPLNNPAKL